MSKSAPKEDQDSPMADNSPTSSTPTTPPPNAATATSIFNSDALSPPDSQTLLPTQPPTAPSPFTPLSGRGAPTTTAKTMPPSDHVNENGKRIWDVLPTDSSKPAEGEAKYKWEREEDAPGWSWGNVKGREEMVRAWGQVVEKERKVGNKYGDVLLK